MRETPFTPGQRFLLLFTLTVIVPGLLLAALGARALWQERRQVQLQLMERLDRGAQTAARELGTQMDRLQLLADSPSPENAFRDWPTDASWAYVERQPQGVPRVYPRDAMPYDLGPFSRLPTTPAEVVDAAKWEGDSSAQQLVVQYRQLLAQVPVSLRPEITHRLARALDRGGQRGEALKLWHAVQAAGGSIGSLPADMVAEFEIARIQPDTARAFYEHLAGGRWRLEKPRYLYYSSVMRESLAPSAEEVRKLALGEAVEAELAQTGEPPAGWRVFRNGTSSTSLLVSKGFLTARAWPTVFQGLDPELAVVRIAQGNATLFGAETDEAGSARSTTVNGWSVAVAPRDAAGFYAAIERRSNLYLAMLVVVLALLASGGYLVTRTVRHELAVARMKAEFVATVSHEFRSPLTGIRQLSEMLVLGRVQDQEKQHQYHESILHESERLGRLVENVLDFARMEDGRKQYRFESLDTAAWLTALANEFRADAARAGYRLESSIQSALPPIAADREALTTAVRNLLENAMKYSPESKVVWLEAQAADDGVLIRVRDQGVGIPPAEQERVFEKFYRGEGDLSEKVKGVGLGLSLVKHIVDAHRGHIRLESREGEGSTFSIHLAGVQ